jgi:hypothetical protein
LDFPCVKNHRLSLFNRTVRCVMFAAFHIASAAYTEIFSRASNWPM